MSAIDTEPFPRGALIAAAAVIGFSLVATTAVRLERLAAPRVPMLQAAPADYVDLRFADQPDGSVSVRDSRTGALIASLAPGTNGFVRGVMRGLAHDRKRRGLDAGPPFRLAESDRSRLTLEDMATGRLVDLEAFGSSNRDAFLKLLHPEDRPS